MKFVKKPIEIEAVRYTGNNKKAIFDFIDGDVDVNLDASDLAIHTLEGDMSVSRGDWVIRGVQGEYYPCKPDIFEMTYDPV